MSTVTIIALALVQLSTGPRPAPYRLPLRGEWTETTHVVSRTTPEEAKPFLGQWTSLVEGLAGPANFSIEVKVNDGRVVASVSSDLIGDRTIEDITTTEQGLALRYTAELWGYSGPVVLTLVRDGDHLYEHFSLLNGWFAFGGLATRRNRS